MLGKQGKDSYLGRTVTIAIVILVAVTPLGREGTSGPIFILHRLLLILITVGAIATYPSKDEPEISLSFLGLCAAAVAMMLLSVFSNPGSLFDGFYHWYQFVLFGAAFLAMAIANRERTVRSKLFILYSVVGITMVYVVAARIRAETPFIGPFVNPNYYASYLLVGFSAAIAVVLFQNNLVHRAAAGGAAVVLYYGMTQAWSRGATVCAVAVSLTAMVRFGRKRGISRLTIAAVLLAVLATGALASPILVRKFRDRGMLDPYNYQRPKIWRAALQVIGTHPWIGVGPGGFYYVSKRFSPPIEGTVARYLKRPAIAHSEYLQQAAEVGIPAAVLLFTLAGYLVTIALRRAQKCRKEQQVFAEAAILAATGIGLHALVDNNWSVPVMAAGLVVFSLGEVLPSGEWQFPFHWSPRTRIVFALSLILITVHAVLIPGLAVSFNEAGQKAYNRNDLDGAESMYRLAAALCPTNSIFLNNVGVVYLDKFMATRDSGWLNYSETFLNEASRANPNSDQPWHILERVLIQRLTGNAIHDRAIHMRIIEVDREVLKIDPVNPFVRKNLAEALYNIGDHDHAEQELRRALEFEPNYVPAYLRLSEWFRESGDQSQGDQYRQRGIAVVTKYENEKTSEAYESLLLGRGQPQATGGPSSQ